MVNKLGNSAMKGEFTVNRNLVDRVNGLVNFDEFSFFEPKSSSWAGPDYIQTRFMPNRPKKERKPR